MDAHTLSATQGTSTEAVSPNQEITVSRELSSRLAAELGTLGRGYIEEQCRSLIQTTASAAIELGRRLAFLKEGTPAEEWLLTLHRIGIGYDAAKRIILMAVRFLAVPDCSHIIFAAKSKSKLLELLVLDDRELALLNQGNSVRGVSLNTLPQTTIMMLRSILRDNRPGAVVDGFSQPAAPMPPTAAPLLGDTPQEEADANAPTSPDSTDYPTIYTLLPGNFNGETVSLIMHEGQAWMIDGEVVDVLARSPEELPILMRTIDVAFDNQQPRDAFAQVYLASTKMLVRLLNKRAIRFLDLVIDTAATTALANWIESSGVQPSDEQNKVVMMAPVKRELTLDQSLTKLGNLHDQFYRMVDDVDAQIHAIKRITENADDRRAPVDVSVLVGIAAKIVEPYNELHDDIDVVMGNIRERLFRNPEAGSKLPESVWLGLVSSLLMHFASDLDMNSAGELALLAGPLNAYSEGSPEVATAFKILKSFAEERGARLHDNPYPGRFAFEWLPGRAPHEMKWAAPEI
jgi:hypothetical protein